MITHTCDRCAKSSTQKKGEKAVKPSGWFALSYSSGYYRGDHQNFELCPECKVALKIPDEKKQPNAVGDQLIELIEDIVAERMEDGI